MIPRTIEKIIITIGLPWIIRWKKFLKSIAKTLKVDFKSIEVASIGSAVSWIVPPELNSIWEPISKAYDIDTNVVNKYKQRVIGTIFPTEPSEPNDITE